MARITLFSVLKNNLGCAFCKNKNCRLRYFPERKKSIRYHGSIVSYTCPKEREKKVNKMLNRKLP